MKTMTENLKTSKLNEDKDGVVKALKEELVGSKILNVGFVDGVEGGLTLDYKKDGIVKRLCLGYTELGEWIDGVVKL